MAVPEDRHVLRGLNRLTLALALILTAGTVSAAHANADPNALWTIVHDQCVPHQEAGGDPAPCAQVDLGAREQHGYAVLKDLVGATQFLLIPTDPVSGIESTALLRP